MLFASCSSGQKNNHAKANSADSPGKRSFMHTDSVAVKINEPTAPVTDTMFGNLDVKSVLKLNVLPTSDGLADDSEVNAFKYPDSVAIDSVPGWNNKIAAYGASYREWLGPKGWTGRGEAGANGGIMVYLFPPGGKEDSGAYISFYDEPLSHESILSNAGQYFSSARKAYNSEYNEDGTDPIKIPGGLKVKRMTHSVVTYTLPVKNGLLTQGVAYYNDTKGIGYLEAKFTLPAAQNGLSNFLLKYYTGEMMGRSVSLE